MDFLYKNLLALSSANEGHQMNVSNVILPPDSLRQVTSTTAPNEPVDLPPLPHYGSSSCFSNHQQDMIVPSHQSSHQQHISQLTRTQTPPQSYSMTLIQFELPLKVGPPNIPQHTNQYMHVVCIMTHLHIPYLL